MALQDILIAIDDDMNGKLEELRKQHQQQMIMLKRESEARTDEYELSVQKQKEEKMKQMRAKARSASQQRRRNMVTRKKRELIDEAYDMVLAQLAKAPQDTAAHFLKRAIERIGDEPGIIHPAKTHAAECERLTADKAYLSVGSPVAATGGFRFVSEKTEMDFTYESLVRNALRPQTELDAASAMFS